MCPDGQSAVSGEEKLPPATADEIVSPYSGLHNEYPNEGYDTSGHHPPTAVMSQKAQSKATSPDHARRQPEARPTAAQEGNTPQPAARPVLADASAALARARELDRQGKEAECMTPIQQAQHLAQPK
jgi:hypothetical protein